MSVSKGEKNILLKCIYLDMIQYKVREYGRNIREKQTGKKNAESGSISLRKIV